MRVLHVCGYYAPAYVYGGPARSLHALCQAQQAHGIDVEVLTTTAAGPERLMPAPDGREFEGVRVRYFALSTPARLLGAAGLPKALARLLPEADVVHLHGLFNRTIWDASRVLHAAAAPYVLSPRGMLEPAALAHHRWRKRVTWRWRDGAVVRRARVLHATSSFERATLSRAEHQGRVVQIANPVAVSAVEPAEIERTRASLSIPAGAPIVLALGRLHRIKRLDLVADAFLSVHSRVSAARLVIAGPDEQRLRPDLERRLAPVQAAVHWVPAIDGRAKDALLAAATVLVQCSDSESFGMSIAEALASGTPVVATRTCPWPELDASGCGFWIEQTADAIAEALERVLTTPALADARGRAGRALIEQQFSPERIAAEWRRTYDGIAGSRTAAA